MASVFVIPRAQTLRFVRTDNYPVVSLQYGQTFDNRLLMDEKWQAPETINEYTQKFAPSDSILIQFTTNYNIDYITINLYNYNKVLIGTLNGAALEKLYIYTDSSGNVTYNFYLSQIYYSAIMSGFYYMQIISTDPDNPPFTYTSEAFEFDSVYANLPYIQWQGSDRDGIYWDVAGETIFGFRAELHQKYTPSSENSIYEGFNFEPETLFAVPKRLLELDSDPIPRYVAEKLELAFKHYTIYINGVPYNANGQSAKITQIDRTNDYDFSISLMEMDYEDYSILQPTSGLVTTPSAYVDYDGAAFIDYDTSVFEGL